MDLSALVEIARSTWVIWLMILFGAVIFWAFRPSNKKRFEDDANIPFNETD